MIMWPVKCLPLVHGVFGMRTSAEKLSVFHLALLYISDPQLFCMPGTRFTWVLYGKGRID